MATDKASVRKILDAVKATAVPPSPLPKASWFAMRMAFPFPAKASPSPPRMPPSWRPAWAIPS